MTDSNPTTGPRIKRPSFYVLMAPEGSDPNTVTDDECTTHHVLVHGGDQLRAELEAGKQGIKSPKDAPMHITMMWLWAAMARTGATTLGWREWKPLCLAYDSDKDRPQPHDQPDAELDELDATPTAASTS